MWVQRGEEAHEYSGQSERRLSKKEMSYDKTDMYFSKDYVCSREPRIRSVDDAWMRYTTLCSILLKCTIVQPKYTIDLCLTDGKGVVVPFINPRHRQGVAHA
jgi:hypothetical protein